MNPARPAAVLWDLDGTLIDTEPYWFAAEREIVAEHGHGIWGDDHSEAMIGFDLLDSAAYLIEHGGVSLEPRQIVNYLVDRVVAGIEDEMPWRPGAKELLLATAKTDVPSVLVTMSWRRIADVVLAALPADTFVGSVTGDEVPEGSGKPSPVPYEMGAKAAGAAPSECVAVEDSPTGVRSALAAGCVVLGVPNIVPLVPGDGLTLRPTLDGLTPHDLFDVFSSCRQSFSAERTTTDPDFPDVAVSTRRRGWWFLVPLVCAGVFAGLVSWDAFTQSKPPPTAIKVDAWLPYWAINDARDGLGPRLEMSREVSPFWYSVKGPTEITVDGRVAGATLDETIAAVKKSPAVFVPSVIDHLPAGEMAAILADPAQRKAHIDALVAFADRLDADGLDIDYEQFAFADGSSTWAATRPNWVAFITELSAALADDDRTLSVSVPGVWNVTDEGSDGYWVYDHGAIAPHVVGLRVMAYDFSIATAGPVAPLDWVQSVVDGVSAAVPAEHHTKLVLGVPSYGRNWAVSTTGVCPESAEGTVTVTARSVDALAAKRGATPTYLAEQGEWTFSYDLAVDDGTTSCVQHRMVYWVDAEGVGARVEIARRADWGGVALWALGYDDDDVWNELIAASTRSIPRTAPTTTVP